MADIKEKYISMEKEETLIQKQRKLIGALERYNELLLEEINRTYQKVEIGVQIRAIILELKKEIEWLEL
jgi:hypothetical protein